MIHIGLIPSAAMIIFLCIYMYRMNKEFDELIEKDKIRKQAEAEWLEKNKHLR